jgi:putative membrane protein
MNQQFLVRVAGAALGAASMASISGGRAAPEPASTQQLSAYDVTTRFRESDADFLKSAALSGKEEVELGRVAAARSLRDGLKSFAEHMLDDHGRGNQRLAELAAARGIDLPDRLDARRQAELDRLSRLSGDEFDRAYAEAMIADHEADVREFQKQSASAHDPDVHAWINAMLVSLEEHREMIHRIARDMETVARKPAVPAALPPSDR